MLNKTSEWIEQVGGLPGILSIIWTMITTFVGDVITAIKRLGSFKVFSDFVWGFASALLKMDVALFKFTLWIYASIVKVAAVIWMPLITPFSVMISKLMELVINFLNWLGEKFVAGANWILDKVRPLVSKIGIELPELRWENPIEYEALTMEEAWLASFLAIKEAGGEAYGNLKREFANLVESGKEFGGDMKGIFLELNPAFGEYGEKLAAAVEQQKQIGKAAKAAGEAAEALPENLNDANDPADDLPKKLGPGSKLWKAITDLGDHVYDSFKAGWEAYKDDLYTHYLGMMEDFAAHMSLTIEREIGDSFYNFLRSGRITFRHGLRAIVEMSRQSLADMFATTFMKQVVTKAVEFMVDIFTGDENGDTGFALIKKKAAGLWDVIAGLWEMSSIHSAIGFVGGVITGIFGGAFNVITAAARTVWDGFGWTKGLIQSRIGNALNWLVELFDENGWSKITSAAKKLWDGFEWTKELIWKAVGTAINYFISLFSGEDGAFSKIIDLAKGLWDTISSQFSKTFTINFEYNMIGEAPTVPSNGTNLPPGGGVQTPDIPGSETNQPPGGGVQTPDIPGSGTHVPGPEEGGAIQTFMDWIGLGAKYEGPDVPEEGKKVWQYLYYVLWKSEEQIAKLYKEFEQYIRANFGGFFNVRGMPSGFMIDDWDNILLRWLKNEKGFEKLHSGGLLSGEGLFLGLAGEGILNRGAMSRIGERGLENLNQGQGIGTTYIFEIHAWDGADVERVVSDKVIPVLKEQSAAGVEVIHENGVRAAR
jgi:hypothetical protein